MREILFRGKLRHDKRHEWVFGSLCVYGSGECTILRQYSPKVMDSRDVIPETVGQWTGLKDNNGKPIFEGDIVDYEDESPGQYEYHDSTFINRGVIEYADGVFYWTNLVAVQLTDTVYKGVANCVVIGNIYDNPELLEVEA